jgi:hypothetical protein
MDGDRAGLFVPLCVGYGARLLGNPPRWHADTETFLACVKKERALLRPERWVPMGELGWVGDAAASGATAEGVLRSAAGRAYRDALASLSGAACPVLPGPWTLAKHLAGDDLEARLDDAILLVANLCRLLIHGNRDLFLWEAFAAGEGPLTEGYGPIYRVLEHCGARAWFVVTGRGLDAVEAYRDARVAAVLFPELDVRADGGAAGGERRVGLGLAAGTLRASDGSFDAGAIAEAARRAACFVPLLDAQAVPENVVRLVEALHQAREHG